jgi:aminoglycoside phosphotransferase (APT) family kinase protein
MALQRTLDLEKTPPLLREWLRSHLDAEEVSVEDLTQPTAGGFSAETLMFTARWTSGGTDQAQGMVLRIAPNGEALFPSYDLEREGEIVAALGAAGSLPVPSIVGIEGDASVLGAPFFVMDRVDGRIPQDSPPFTSEGWVMELAPADRRRLDENALAALAALHMTAAEHLDHLRPSDAADSPLDRQLAYWREFYEWIGGPGSNPVIDAGFEWIEAHRPAAPEPVVLNWGDARHPNMIFDEKLDVAAILDWEMATFGSPEVDLGYWVFGLRHHTEGLDLPMPEGFLTRDEVIERYQQLTGHAVRNLDFYEVFATLRAAIVIARMASLMITADLLPPHARLGIENGAVRLLTKLIGLAGRTRPMMLS